MIISPLSHNIVSRHFFFFSLILSAFTGFIKETAEELTRCSFLSPQRKEMLTSSLKPLIVFTVCLLMARGGHRNIPFNRARASRIHLETFQLSFSPHLFLIGCRGICVLRGMYTSAQNTSVSSFKAF